MHVCVKGKCPNRLAVGSENDSDVVHILCSQCHKVIPHSDSKSIRAYETGKKVLILLALISIGYLGYKWLLKPTVLDLVSAQKYIIAYHEKGDDKDYQGQLAMMDFDLLKYYDTQLTSYGDVSKHYKDYYQNRIEWSDTRITQSQIVDKGISTYTTNNIIDTLYTYEYPIEYTYRNDKKEEKLEIRSQIQLVQRNNDWKIKSIEELSRKILESKSIVAPPQPKDTTTEKTITTKPIDDSKKSSSKNPMGPKETLEKFAEYMVKGNWQEAYALTNNQLWNPYDTFKNKAWGNLRSFSITRSTEEKFYNSKYGGQRIYEMGLKAYDYKQKEWRNMLFDFHLRQETDGWKIIRRIDPKESRDQQDRPITISAITVYYDNDGDGYGNEFRSRSVPSNDIPKNYVRISGDCDDASFTINPSIQEKCNNDRDDDCDGLVDEGCEEIIAPITDSDGDGITDDKDKCPERFSVTSIDGCPEFSLKEHRRTLYRGERSTFEINNQQMIVSDDNIKWDTEGGRIIGPDNKKSCTAVFSEVGLHRMNMEISNNRDGFYSQIIPGKVYVEIRKSELSRYLMNLAELGNKAKFGMTKEMDDRGRQSEITVMSMVESTNIKVVSGNYRVDKLSLLLNKLKAPKRSVGTQIKSVDVSRIVYSTDTGKIKEIYYSINY